MVITNGLKHCTRLDSRTGRFAARDVRAINHAHVVTREAVAEDATVVFEDGRVAGLAPRPERGAGTIDAAGRYVLPGLVDLHSDSMEREYAPRPGADLSVELAFLETDRSYASAGITTAFNAIAFVNSDPRTIERGRRFFGVVQAARAEALVHHELHGRFEVAQIDSIDTAESLIPGGDMRMVSLMNLESHKSFLDERREARDQVAPDVGRAWDHFDRFRRSAQEHSVLLASHDDAEPARLDRLAAAGFSIFEMPVNVETARRAKDLGLFCYMGAPNVFRGRSYVGNLSAMHVAELGLLQGLCSDYYPPSLVQAVFQLARRRTLSLPAAVALVTSAPALAVGLGERGDLRPGSLADAIVVGERLGLPVVTHTIVCGKLVYNAER